MEWTLSPPPPPTLPLPPPPPVGATRGSTEGRRLTSRSPWPSRPRRRKRSPECRHRFVPHSFLHPQSFERALTARTPFQTPLNRATSPPHATLTVKEEIPSPSSSAATTVTAASSSVVAGDRKGLFNEDSSGSNSNLAQQGINQRAAAAAATCSGKKKRKVVTKGRKEGKVGEGKGEEHGARREGLCSLGRSLGRSGLKEKITGLVYPAGRRNARADGGRRPGRRGRETTLPSCPVSAPLPFKKWFGSTKSEFVR